MTGKQIRSFQNKDILRKINLVDEYGIVHDFAYEEECNALNALGDEIGHMRVYQDGYYHTFDGNGKNKSYIKPNISEQKSKSKSPKSPKMRNKNGSKNNKLSKKRAKFQSKKFNKG